MNNIKSGETRLEQRLIKEFKYVELSYMCAEMNAQWLALKLY